MSLNALVQFDLPISLFFGELRPKAQEAHEVQHRTNEQMKPVALFVARLIFTFFLLQGVVMGQWKPLGPEYDYAVGCFDNRIAVADENTFYTASSRPYDKQYLLNKFVNGSKVETWKIDNLENSRYFDLTIGPDKRPYLCTSNITVKTRSLVVKTIGPSNTLVDVTGFNTVTTGIIIRQARFSPTDHALYVLCFTDRLHLRKFDGTSWTDFGAPIATQNTYSHKLEFDKNGVPYVLVTLQNESLLLLKWTNNEWVTVGGTALRNGYNAANSFCFADDGITPIVAYGQPGFNQGSNAVVVATFTDGAWKKLPTTPKEFTSFGTKGLNLTCVKDTIYLFHCNLSGDAMVQRFDGKKWSSYENIGNIDVDQMDIAMGRDGFPLIVFSSVSHGYPQIIFRFDGTSWTEPYPSSISTRSAQPSGILLNRNGIPYIAYIDGDVYVKRFIEGRWTFLAPPVPATNARNVTLRLAPNNVLFLAYQSEFLIGSMATSKLSVKAFINGSWVSQGAEGFSENIDLFYMDFDAAGTPYVCYAELNTQRKLVIKKLSNGEWIDVTPPSPLSSPTARILHPRIKFSAANVLHVAYAEEGVYSLVVKKLENGNWSTVASMPATPRTSYPILSEFYFDSEQRPVFGLGIGYGTTIIRYSGGTWETLNPNNVIGGAVDTHNNRIAMTANGGLVALGIVAGGLAVYEYTGGIWKTSPTIKRPDLVADQHSIAIDNNGRLVVAYSLPNGVFGNTMGDIPLTEQYLPFDSDLFSLKTIATTCRGTKDGALVIRAKDSRNYVASISGSSLLRELLFTDSTRLENLVAGTYTVRLTLRNDASQERFYTVTVGEPAALKVGFRVDDRKISLQLEGGSVYFVKLNGSVQTFQGQEASLDLKPGLNTFTVSTERSCQGEFTRQVFCTGKTFAYPNPFGEVLFVNLPVMSAIEYELVGLDGKKALSGRQGEPGAGLEIRTASLANGIYLLSVKAPGYSETFTVIKR